MIDAIINGMLAGLASLAPAAGSGAQPWPARPYLRELRRYTGELRTPDVALGEGGIYARTPAILVAFAGQRRLRSMLSGKSHQMEGTYLALCCSDIQRSLTDRNVLYGILEDCEQLLGGRQVAAGAAKLKPDQVVTVIEDPKLYCYGLKFTTRYWTQTVSAGPFDILTDVIGRVWNTRSTFGPQPIAAPAIAVIGTPGATTWGYVVAGESDDGALVTLKTPEGRTLTGAAVLTGANFNRPSWPAIPGAARYRVYRTTANGTPNTVGKIATTAALTLDDTGLAADGVLPVDPPTVDANRHY
jgi:hypothetical protein